MHTKHPGASSVPDRVKEHRESVFLPAGGAVRERAWMAWTQVLQLMEDEDSEVSCVLNHAAAQALPSIAPWTSHVLECAHNEPHRHVHLTALFQ